MVKARQAATTEPASRGRRLGLHLAAPSAYVALALLLSWPLPEHLGSHITGAPGGDAGVYVWNQWVFRQELLTGDIPPFRTERVLAFGEPADLSLHNYTVFADLLSLPLQERLGLIASFNVVYLALLASSAYAMFLLALAVTGAPLPAFLAGALFGFSPFLIARGTAHYSLVAAAPLPLFMLCLLRLGGGGRWPWAVAAGLTLGWSAYCDPYYLVFCALMLGMALLHEAFEVSRATSAVPPTSRRLRRLFGACALAGGLIGLGIAVTGGGHLRLAGVSLALKSLYTPALVFTLGLAGLLLLHARPRLVPRPGFLARSVPLLLLGLAAGVVVLSPLLLALARRAAEGDFDPPSVLWRSSPAGVDLLAFLMPNPNHALFGEVFQRWLARLRPDGYAENAASLTLTALGIVGLACLRRAALPRAWAAFTLFFGALALGPFVWVGGFNTALPTPWTLLRFVPGVGLVRTPTRFAIVAMLGFAVLFAFALRELRARARPARRAVLLGAVAALLVFELAPVPVALHAAAVPPLFQEVAADPCDVSVLDIPFGLRDGTRSVGDFSAVAQFHQTLHGKPLVGGYLSRIPERVLESYRRFPLTDALILLSEDLSLTPEAAAQARLAARAFMKRTRLGFVVIDRSRTSRRLRRFAIDTLGLERVDEQWPYELLVPEAARCGGGRGSCAHASSLCPLRVEDAQGISSSPGSAAPSLERSTGRVAPPSDR